MWLAGGTVKAPREGHRQPWLILSGEHGRPSQESGEAVKPVLQDSGEVTSSSKTIPLQNPCQVLALVITAFDDFAFLTV